MWQRCSPKKTKTKKKGSHLDVSLEEPFTSSMCVYLGILLECTESCFVPPGKHPEKLGGSAESLIPGFQPTQGDAFAASSFAAGTG